MNFKVAIIVVVVACFVTSFFISCGTDDKVSSCQIISDTDEEAIVQCGPRTTIISKGKDGSDGIKGEAGSQGGVGQQGATGSKGEAGQQGDTGNEGASGKDGVSIVFSKADPGTDCRNGGEIILIAYDTNGTGAFEISDTGIQSITICNGTNGTDGANGSDAPSTPFTPVSIINPCGDKPAVYDEIFLKLANGTILASFSDNADGKNTRFSVLTPNTTYRTTDGDNCVFTIDANGNVTNESHTY